MKDVSKIKALKIYELITGIILLLVLVALMFLNAGNIINTGMNSIAIIVFLIPVLAKVKKYEILEDIEKNLRKNDK